MIGEQRLFEEEVLRIARALFSPEADLQRISEESFQGSAYLGHQERDGIIVGEDSVTVIEATVSKLKAKAAADGKKLAEDCSTLARQYHFKSVKAFVVTRDEPTVDPRKAITDLRAAHIVACSFKQFHCLLVDAREYLTLRRRYPFGSAREPRTGNHAELEDYVQIDLHVIL